MNILEYKGYKAKVDFDDRDNIFIGRVLGIRTIIGFHGESVTELKQSFEDAINFMIEDCNTRGIDPEKPASGHMMLRVPPETHRAAIIAAQASGMSLNQWATIIFNHATDNS